MNFEAGGGGEKIASLAQIVSVPGKKEKSFTTFEAGLAQQPMEKREIQRPANLVSQAIPQSVVLRPILVRIREGRTLVRQGTPRQANTQGTQEIVARKDG